jgi:hypothetical protein
MGYFCLFTIMYKLPLSFLGFYFSKVKMNVLSDSPKEVKDLIFSILYPNRDLSTMSTEVLKIPHSYIKMIKN